MTSYALYNMRFKRNAIMRSGVVFFCNECKASFEDRQHGQTPPPPTNLENPLRCALCLFIITSVVNIIFM